MVSLKKQMKTHFEVNEYMYVINLQEERNMPTVLENRLDCLETFYYLWFFNYVHLSHKAIQNHLIIIWRPVEEDAADVIMADGWFLGAGSHPQGPEEAVDQDVELVDVPATER